MWEFSLFFEKDLLPYFNQLVDFLKNKFVDVAKSISIGVTDFDYVFLVALPNQFEQECKAVLQQKLADIICLFYKPKSVLSALKNFDLMCSDNKILLSILSCYDNTSDQLIVEQKLQLNQKLFLKSFVDFKLNFQKNKWKEIGNLLNQNNLFLADKIVKKELIKFLLNGLKIQTKTILLHQTKNNVVAINQSNQKIEIPTLFFATEKYDELLFCLIKNFPQKIQVQNSKNFDAHLLQQLHFLFGSALCLC